MDLDNAMNLALAVGITAVLAAICFVIWYLRSNVVHPLDALVDAMRRISAGDLSVRADWNPVNSGVAAGERSVQRDAERD